VRPDLGRRYPHEGAQASKIPAQRPRLALVAEWIYFLHPPRENFAQTMTRWWPAGTPAASCGRSGCR